MLHTKVYQGGGRERSPWDTDSAPKDVPDSDGQGGSTVTDEKGHKTHYNKYGKADEFEGEC